nr:sulfur carrier protein ThiS [Cytophagales bacterium]
MITIHMNGEEKTLESEITVLEFLNKNGYRNKMVAVAVNQSFVPRSSYNHHTIKQNDTIEIVAPMQGG